MKNKQALESEKNDDASRLKERIHELESKLSENEKLISDLTSKNVTYTDVLNHVPLAMLSLDTFGYIQFINSTFSKLFD